MRLRYVGQKPLPYRLSTPIPYLSRSEHVGTLEFTPECDVPEQAWADYLLHECGEAFESCEPAVESIESDPANKFAPISDEEREKRFQAKIEITIGKRFQGKAAKWNGFAYLKKHKLGEVLGLKKLQIGDKVMHWEVVPLALADVGVHQAPIPWNKTQEGQKEESDEPNSDRERIEV